MSVLFGVEDAVSGYTCEDIESEIKAMTREMIQTQSRADGLQASVWRLKNAYIIKAVEKAGIREGDKCVMHFSDCSETVVYAGMYSGLIEVHHVNTKGRPQKSTCRYPYTCASHLEKIQE